MSVFWKTVTAGAKTKTGQKIISALTGGKQKTTGREVITKFKKKFKKQKSPADIKFTGALKKWGDTMTSGMGEAVGKFGQVEQKVLGRPVTKSGWSKGKDLPPPKKKKD